MNLRKLIFTENACYKAGAKMSPKKIMVHSTGANNPYLKRYVGPDDGLLGKNQYGNHWNQNKPDGLQVCVHGFIGKLADESIASYQTLPWDMVGWHSGSGKNGSANRMGYIGFEICEDNTNDPVYFAKVYQEAVELCAYLCQMYNLDPIQDIICHSEGYKMGIASNHADVMHWFPKHGKSMDTFREAVKAAVTSGSPDPTKDTGKGENGTQGGTGADSGGVLTVGTEVDFTGSRHYTSSYPSAVGKTCKSGRATITAVSPGSAHPYHVIAVSGKGSTVHGWVDAKDISAIVTLPIQKGDKVKVLKATTYTGGTFKTWYDTYDVISVNGDRAVIGIGKTVTAAVNIANIQRV